MYLSSHTRGIPKKSGPSDQFRTYSGPLLALRSGSGPSPEFRTLVVPLDFQFPNYIFQGTYYKCFSTWFQISTTVLNARSDGDDN